MRTIESGSREFSRREFRELPHHLRDLGISEVGRTEQVELQRDFQWSHVSLDQRGSVQYAPI